MRKRLPDFFYNHFGLAGAADFPAPEDENAVPAWTNLVLELPKAPYITIAAVGGRTSAGQVRYVYLQLHRSRVPAYYHHGAIRTAGRSRTHLRRPSPRAALNGRPRRGGWVLGCGRCAECG